MNAAIRSAWLSSMLSTEPADRPRAEAALRDLYAAVTPAGLPPPAHFFWFDNPYQAAWTVALLTGAAAPEPEIASPIRAALCQRAHRDWEGITSAAGGLLHLYYRPIPDRMRVHNNKLRVIHNGDQRDVLWRADFRLVLDRQPGQPTVPYLESPFQQGYSFYMMAIPDLGADAKLLNERHALYFVEYLRVAFRFGGFPGYDGTDPLPPKLASLRKGLLEF